MSANTNKHLKKWQQMFADYSQLQALPFSETLTPFYGLPQYQKLTEEQKLKLFYSYQQFIAETFIIFEQLLLVSIRQIKKTASPNFTPELEAFGSEESFHSKAFRMFLQRESNLPWSSAGVSFSKKGNTWFKRIFQTLVRYFPYCLYMPGAKIEIYSVDFAKFLALNVEHECPQKVAWVKLNLLHMSDEVRHIPIDFQVIEAQLKASSLSQKLLTVFSTYLAIVLVQWLPLRGFYKIICYTFPELSILKKIRLTLQIIKWGLYTFPPSQKSRIKLQEIIGQSSTWIQKPFAFMSR